MKTPTTAAADGTSPVPPVHGRNAAAATAAALAGRRVVVTRPEGAGADALRDALAARGATVLDLPLIEIEFTADAAALEDAWTAMGNFDWIVFTSANGARGFFDRFFETFNDIRGLGLARFACVGAATSEILRALHLNVDFEPAKATAGALANELLAAEDLAHLRVLVVTGSKNDNELPKTLERDGKAIVETLAVYATFENDVGQLDATENFRRLGADAIVFASPSAVESFVAQARQLTLAKSATRPRIVAIGPTTAGALREHALPVAAIATSPAPEAVADAVTRAVAE